MKRFTYIDKNKQEVTFHFGNRWEVIRMIAALFWCLL